MSDIDLSAATNAAMAAYLPTVGQYVSNRERIDVIVAAAAPVIEAQVRAQIAAEIKDVRYVPGHVKGAAGSRHRALVESALNDAAERIARADS